jgi:hypothetical protein
MTLYSLRDFKPYGHTHHAIKKWAEQFELMTRKLPGQKLRDSSFITLWLY